jgi:hypothetical protein
MPDPTARDRYLDEVAARLRLPDHLQDEVIEEIAAHLADSIEDDIGRGMPMDEAERQAIERLGPARPLADRIRRTHQSTRRLFAAVGGGMWAAGRDGIRGYILGIVAVFALAVGVSGVGGAVASALSLKAPESLADVTVYTAMTGVAFWFAAWWAASSLIVVLAARSNRRVSDVRVPVGLVGTTLVAVVVVLVETRHNWLSVAAFLGIPLCFLVSSLLTGRGVGGDVARRWLDRDRIGYRAMAILVVVLVVTAGLGAIVAAGRGPAAGSTIQASTPVPADGVELPGGRWRSAGFSRVAPRVVAGDDAPWRMSGWAISGEPVFVSLSPDELDWDAWPSLRLEAWRATLASDMGGDEDPVLDAGSSGPFATAPIVAVGQGPTRIDLGRDREARAFYLFLLSVDPATGKRVAIGMPQWDETVFSGNLVDWFTAT